MSGVLLAVMSLVVAAACILHVVAARKIVALTFRVTRLESRLAAAERARKEEAA